MAMLATGDRYPTTREPQDLWKAGRHCFLFDFHHRSRGQRTRDSYTIRLLVYVRSVYMGQYAALRLRRRMTCAFWGS